MTFHYSPPLYQLSYRRLLVSDMYFAIHVLSWVFVFVFVFYFLLLLPLAYDVQFPLLKIFHQKINRGCLVISNNIVRLCFVFVYFLFVCFLFLFLFCLFLFSFVLKNNVFRTSRSRQQLFICVIHVLQIEGSLASSLR